MIGGLDQPQEGWAFDEILYVRGWALDDSGPAAEVSVFLGDERLGAAELGIDRPDLGARFRQIPDSGRGGFLFCGPRANSSPFHGELRVVARSADGAETVIGKAGVSSCEGRSTIHRVNVEFTNACNLHCRWCTTHSRKPGAMTRLTFEQVLTEVARSQQLDVRELHFYNAGEPLLHPRFSEFMAISQRVFSGRVRNRPKRVLVTNGTQLDEARVESLLSGGIEEVHVSVDQGTKESYESHCRGAVWEETLAGVHLLLSANEAKGHPVRTVLLTIVLGVAPSAEFEAMAARFDQYAPRAPHTWDGSTNLKGLPRKPPNPRPCWHAFNNIVVLWNGDVTACCADLIGRGVMGNTGTASLAEHWTGPHHALRLAQCQGRKSGIAACRRCSIP
jgi:pyruvate-formate lyase-activating enzyme